MSGWSVRLTASWPFRKRFAAFASAGALVWDTDLRIRLAVDDEPLAEATVEGDDLLYDAGLRLRLTDRWSIEASYENVDLDIESTRIGATFRF